MTKPTPPASVAPRERGRSRRLLGSLLRPHRRRIFIAVAVIAGFNLASMAGPLLVELGIDRGIPALVHHRGAGTLVVIVGFLVLAALVQAVTDYAFTLLTGRIGQDLLFDLRARLFDHFQGLSLSFHEDYTSGRVISRLTRMSTPSTNCSAPVSPCSPGRR